MINKSGTFNVNKVYEYVLNNNTFINYIVSAYHKKSKGQKCNDYEVEISENSCKEAADKLRLSYKGTLTEITRPAGCYWSSSNVYYNEPTTVSANAAYSGNRGGICWIEGIRFIFTLLKSCSQYG